MKIVLKTLILLVLFVSFSCTLKDTTAVDTTPNSTDFITVLTNGSSKDWLINTCLSPYFYNNNSNLVGQVLNSTLTFKSDKTGKITTALFVVLNTFTWQYDEATKTLSYITNDTAKKKYSIYISDYNINAINASKVDVYDKDGTFIKEFKTADIGCAVGLTKK